MLASALFEDLFATKFVTTTNTTSSTDIARYSGGCVGGGGNVVITQTATTSDYLQPKIAAALLGVVANNHKPAVTDFSLHHGMQWK